MNELHTRIDLEFKKAGIEIAFPQHDLHLRSVDQKLVSLMQAREDAAVSAPERSGAV